jgi:hypothetical protein
MNAADAEILRSDLRFQLEEMFKTYDVDRDKFLDDEEYQQKVFAELRNGTLARRPNKS